MITVLTYQDFKKAADVPSFLLQLHGEYTSREFYRTALDADAYDHRRNTTICNFVQKLFSASGNEAVNFAAANSRLTSNFFRRINTQRCTYSLGNGISFSQPDIKKKLGEGFDTVLIRAGYAALIHGVAYIYWAYNRAYCFRATEFAPLFDEETGALMAGMRFWRLAPDKPLYIELYEQDGVTKYRGYGGELVEIEPKRPYKLRVAKSAADGERIIGGENYGSLPIVPLWGSTLRQSTLVGLKETIDAYDIIASGFANDLRDCAQIYWIIKNAGGMSADDLDELRTRLLLTHMLTVDGDAGADVTAHQNEIPYEAREACLARLKSSIYEDFGALDVHTIAAGATNDHIDAAYQPLDEQADDFEYCVIEAVTSLLALLGVTGDAAVPLFKRNRISNVKERMEVLALEAPYLDDETILSKLPDVTEDEIAAIKQRKLADETKRFSGNINADNSITDASDDGENK